MGTSNETAELLFQAVHYKNADLLQDLVNANKEIISSVRSTEGRTPLHYAAAQGSGDCVTVLCKYVDIDAVSGIQDFLRTPLLLAAQNGHAETVQILVQQGADIFYCDANGYTALQLAQINNHNKVAELLFESIDFLRKESEQLRKTLCEACKNNNYGVVLDVLAESTASSRREMLGVGKNGEKSPLYLACENGHADIITALLTVQDHCVIDSPSGNTLLHAVIASGNVDATKVVLENFGDHMDVINNDKHLPFHVACQVGNVDILELLLTFKYSPNLLNLFEKTINGFSYEYVCDLNAADSYCKTPLHLAVENNHEKTVDYLVAFTTQLFRQADIGTIENAQKGNPFLLDTYSINGRTPLMTAVKNGQGNIVEALLENGADVNLPIAITDLEIANLTTEEARCVGSGALIEAALNNNVALVKQLFYHGAIDYDNQALRQASTASNSAMITVFLEQLTFSDPDKRINSQDQVVSAIDRLKSMDLLPTLRPTVACRLDWQNAGLNRIGVEFLMAATIRFNPRVRNVKMALSAITRIDLSDNNISELPENIFQLTSLKSLNLNQNHLKELQFPRNEFTSPYLETFSAEGNELEVLSGQLFNPKSFPRLKSVNLSKNHLKTLPSSLWKHPNLVEINLSDNLIMNLMDVSPDRQRRDPRNRAANSRNPYVQAYYSGQTARGMMERRQQERRQSEREERNQNQRRKSSTNVEKTDVIRSNIWQNEINMTGLEEEDAEKSSPRSPTRQQPQSTNSLKTLNLSGNNLKSIPEFLACFCPKLTKLDLSKNHLSDLKALECFPGTLKHLNLANNKLTIMFKPADITALHCFASQEQSTEAPPQQSVSVVRHSRSRSKSVARNQQRSLSIIRASKENENTNLCVHKLHCRFEQLKSLNLAHNQLKNFDLFIPFEARHEDSSSRNWKDSNEQMRSRLIFPFLTNLDLSHNNLKAVPPQISLLSQLAVLNLNENRSLEKLPVELGLLEKLWSVQVNNCQFSDPLKGIVGSGTFKTMDLISFLRNELDNSKPYPKLKLMLLGRSEVGKTILLQQLRAEGNVPKNSTSTNSWALRLGHKPNPKFVNKEQIHRYPVDVSEWSYEPPKSSKTLQSNGVVTFRTWDFDRLQKEFQQVPQYFLSRRSICIIVWKLTDGEIAINEIHHWLLAVHARAPNTTCIIVGTHLDSVQENIQRFPDGYLGNFERMVQQRFVNVADADKKGLPRVVASVFVSTKSRPNIQQLCELIYCAAQQIKSVGRRQKLLHEKIPSSFLHLEKLIVNITDETRFKNDEPIVKIDELWARANEDFQQMKLSTSQSTASLVSIGSQNQGKGEAPQRRLFRDRLEFRQAIQFLQENGVIVSFDDTQLRDYVFIDPQWLYTVLRTSFVASSKASTTSANIQPGQAILSNQELFQQLKNNLLDRRIKFSFKKGLLRNCLLPLLSKYEAALPCLTRQLLIAPLLPDEYLLRADYPGAKIKIRSKFDKFKIKPTSNSSVISSSTDLSASRYSARTTHTRLARQLGYRPPSNKRQPSLVSSDMVRSDSFDQDLSGLKFEVTHKDLHRRLYVMQYIPPGFWPRLTTRILNDEKISQILSELFTINVEDTSNLTNECALFNDINDALNVDRSPEKRGGFEFLLWQTGMEILLFDEYIFSLKEFLPLASVRDTNYSVANLQSRGDDACWRKLNCEENFIVELLIPSIQINLTWKSVDYSLKTHEKHMTILLASVVCILDDLLEDWFPSLGTRFVHSSDGQLLVDRLIPCPECARKQAIEEKQWRKDRKTSDPITKTLVHLFSIEECILAQHDDKNEQHGINKDLKPEARTEITCPTHGECSLMDLAPDVCFQDLTDDFNYDVNMLKRGKLLGRGAFGAVYAGFAKSRNEIFDEVALKILEPTDDNPASRIRCPSNVADRLESVARSYCVARQELNMLCDLRHQHITLLLGFSRPPITLLMELAPHGALDQLLVKYRKSETPLAWDTLQQTCAQIAKAIEFLHSNHIIYRDLKAENVLVWRYPLPRQHKTPNSVSVKLGDYGISRFSYPNDVCKGYGGTEGFMAPEILRYNGEYEYTEKIDCYSFGMFIYELITLRHPYDGQEQMKDCIFEGQRPMINDKDILCPSNVLDLMVVCWAENATERPSSSELVTITSAPEFTHLSDVALLTSDEISAVSTIYKPVNSDQPAQCWLTRPDGAVTILHFSQFGWIESETIGPLRSTQVTAISEVAKSVWLGNAVGEIIVYCPHTYNELASFQVTSIDSRLNNSNIAKTIRQIDYYAERTTIIIALPLHVIICASSNSVLPQHITTICCEEVIHTAVLIPSVSDLQIWTAHDEARIINHHIVSNSNKLLYSASSHHPNSNGADTPSSPRVKFLVPSKTVYGNAWSSLENDGRVFMWKSGAVRRTLDCSKILPVSETLSSMFDDQLNQRCRITALSVFSTSSNEQLLVGTQTGVIIVLESKFLSPLTSFRTYGSSVETILCTSRLPILASGEERINGTSVTLLSESPFFVTIGRKYRNLVKRLASNVLSTENDEEQQSDNVNYAVVWQGDYWG